MRELAEQIDSHMKVIDVDNPTSNVPKGSNAPEINPVLTPSTSGKVSFITLTVAQDPVM